MIELKMIRMKDMNEEYSKNESVDEGQKLGIMKDRNEEYE